VRLAAAAVLVVFLGIVAVLVLLTGRVVGGGNLPAP
jgi:hypothetical protein